MKDKSCYTIVTVNYKIDLVELQWNKSFSEVINLFNMDSLILLDDIINYVTLKTITTDGYSFVQNHNHSSLQRKELEGIWQLNLEEF